MRFRICTRTLDTTLDICETFHFLTGFIRPDRPFPRLLAISVIGGQLACDKRVISKTVPPHDGNYIMALHQNNHWAPVWWQSGLARVAAIPPQNHTCLPHHQAPLHPTAPPRVLVRTCT